MTSNCLWFQTCFDQHFQQQKAGQLVFTLQKTIPLGSKRKIMNYRNLNKDLANSNLADSRHYRTDSEITFTTSVQDKNRSEILKEFPIKYGPKTPKKVQINREQNSNINLAPYWTYFKQRPAVTWTLQKNYEKPTNYWTPQKDNRKIQFNYTPNISKLNYSGSTTADTNYLKQSMNSSAIAEFSKRKRLFDFTPKKDPKSYLSVRKITEHDRQIESEMHQMSQLLISSNIYNSEEQYVQIQ